MEPTELPEYVSHKRVRAAKITALDGGAATDFALGVNVQLGEDVKDDDEHWVPPFNSIEAWNVGDGRCFYCLAREDAEEFELPCPRRRPVELA